jgi:hypothetical protein
MKHRLCYISRNYRNVENSGNKAKTDNETTLRELGAHNLGLPTTYYDSKILTFFIDLAGVVRFCFAVRKGDRVVLQYPVKKYFSFLCNMAHLRGARVVALIHDLGSMRRKKLTVAKEISRLMHADLIIASNATMEQWLSRQGFSHKLGHLQLFDYRSTAVASPLEGLEPTVLPRVVYAGALAQRKNTFLLKMADMAESYQLEIFGNREGLPGLHESERVHLHPFMKSEDFIAHAPGHFGLVWDGDSLETCSGNFGEYLRWNSPHKASFYLRAGMPLIVWRESALAPIVEQEGIGFCIRHLAELNGLLAALTPESYAAMLSRVRLVSDRLRTGHYFRTALSRALEALDAQP